MDRTEVTACDHDVLIRRHCPIVRFDDRELFFPTEVDGFVKASALMRDEKVILPEGELSLDRLGDGLADHYLRFVSEEERRAVVGEEAKRLARKLLSPRLGRVGLFGRVFDAIYRLIHIIRPTVPNRTVTAAALKADRLGLHKEVPVTYARAVMAGEWLVLHYAYFYLYNDWRSSYRGLNDHEGDWEQAWIFCDPQDGSPQWVVASSHDISGANLRRHWNDPELIVSDGRPVLHAGAGSHALYFRPGDYVTRLDVPGLRWLLRLQRWTQGALRIKDQAAERGLGPAFGAPFVDTATADGLDARVWDIRDLDDRFDWVGRFRGLWGLDTHDPGEGERGPGGPKFNRQAEVRVSWADPVGFAGLHGTPPPSAMRRQVTDSRLGEVLEDLDRDISVKARKLPFASQTEPNEDMVEEATQLTELLRQRSELSDLKGRVEAGVTPDIDYRGHLDNPAVPLPPPAETGYILTFWSVVSVPLVLLSIAAVLVFESLTVAGFTLVVAAGVILAEQLARRRFQAFVRLSAIFVMLTAFFAFAVGGLFTVGRFAAGALVAFAAAVLFISNLGELGAATRHRRRSNAARSEHEDPPVHS
ncbi:MAG: hypothetical protein HKN24_02350 [Acidimicrobiales bacterium]|nr:hypothetical protein [Acidimicrobiales bacterium]